MTLIGEYTGQGENTQILISIDVRVFLQVNGRNPENFGKKCKAGTRKKEMF